jgi:hypothetical protein
MLLDITCVGMSSDSAAVCCCWLHVQALTTSVAFWYGLETFKLRGQMVEEVSFIARFIVLQSAQVQLLCLLEKFKLRGQMVEEVRASSASAAGSSDSQLEQSAVRCGVSSCVVWLLDDVLYVLLWKQASIRSDGTKRMGACVISRDSLLQQTCRRKHAHLAVVASISTFVPLRCYCWCCFSRRMGSQVSCRLLLKASSSLAAK